MTGEIYNLFGAPIGEQPTAEAEPEFWATPKTEQQIPLFDIEEPWQKIWKGMPEYEQSDLTAWKSMVVHFATPGDLMEFARLIDQKLTPKTRFAWFPSPDGEYSYVNKRYSDAA